MHIVLVVLLLFSTSLVSADWGDADVLSPSFADETRFDETLDLSGSLNTTPDLPDWTQGLILYQMSIDRFGEEPTINSAREKLHTLSHLGITGVVLTPIAKAFKGHGWEPADYRSFYSSVEPDQIDPVLGTDEDFTAFVQELHAMGIKVFLDMEFHGLFDRDVFLTKMWWPSAYEDAGPEMRSSLLDAHPEFFEWTNTDGVVHPIYTGWNTAELFWKHGAVKNTALMDWYRDALVYDWIQKFDLDGFRLDLEPYEVANVVGYDYWESVRTLAKAATGKDIVLIPEDGNAGRNNAFAFAQEDFGVSNVRFGDPNHPSNRVYDFMVSEHMTNYPETNPDVNRTVDPVHILDVVKGNGYPLRTETFYSSGIGVHDNKDFTAKGRAVYFGYTLFQPFIPIWWMGNEFNVRNLTVDFDPMHQLVYFNRLTWSDRVANADFLNTVRKAIYIRKKFRNLIGPSTHRLMDKPMLNATVLGDNQPDLPGYAYYNPTGDPVGIVVLGTKTTSVGPAQIQLDLSAMRLDGHANYTFHNLMADSVTSLTPINGNQFYLPDPLPAWDFLIYKIEPIPLPTAATTPFPPDGATNVPLRPTLSWTPGSHTETHAIYGGISPDVKHLFTTSGTSTTIGTLSLGKTYYWSVHEINGQGSTPGPIWSFTTEHGDNANKAAIHAWQRYRR